MDKITTPKILCGDFNLRSDTQSMNILNEGMINLIDEYDIKSTRTSFYPKAEKYADYVITSRDIHIKQFEVLPDEVSDHSALYAVFE